MEEIKGKDAKLLSKKTGRVIDENEEKIIECDNNNNKRTKIEGEQVQQGPETNNTQQDQKQIIPLKTESQINQPQSNQQETVQQNIQQSNVIQNQQQQEGNKNQIIQNPEPENENVPVFNVPTPQQMEQIRQSIFSWI